MRKIFQKGFVQFSIIIGIVIILYISMYPPDFLLFKKVSNHAIQVMLLLVLAGVIFLILRVPLLTFVSFASVAMMSIFFKTTTNFSMARPNRTFSPSFDFAFFKTSSFGVNFQDVLEMDGILKKDIIGIQEFTPDWKEILDASLGDDFPYKAEFLQINDFGQVIYSKYPITFIDTIGQYEDQSLFAEIEVEKTHKFVALSNYNLPPTHSQAYEELGMKLDNTTQYLKAYSQNNILIFGAFNLVSWDVQIGEFKKELNLSESRMGFFPPLSEGANGMWQKPVDHIFISEGLECLNFELFSYRNSNQGVFGTFQFKLDE